MSYSWVVKPKRCTYLEFEDLIQVFVKALTRPLADTVMGTELQI